VIATEAVITCAWHNLSNAIAAFQQGNVEGAPAKVEDENGLLLLALFKPVCKSRCGWLVNNTQNVQTCNLASFLGGLTLSVFEVSRNSNNRVGDVLTRVSLSVALELHQGASGDFLRGVLLVVNIDAPVGADVALD